MQCQPGIHDKSILVLHWPYTECAAGVNFIHSVACVQYTQRRKNTNKTERHERVCSTPMREWANLCILRHFVETQWCRWLHLTWAIWLWPCVFYWHANNKNKLRCQIPANVDTWKQNQSKQQKIDFKWFVSCCGMILYSFITIWYPKIGGKNEEILADSCFLICINHTGLQRSNPSRCQWLFWAPFPPINITLI